MPALSRSQFVFRVTMLSFASVLAAFSLWTLLPVPLGANVALLPTDPEAAAVAAASRERAGAAARIGAVRGDLWAQSAFTYGMLLWPGPEQDPSQGATASQARTAVERALAHAPHAAGAWLPA